MDNSSKEVQRMFKVFARLVAYIFRGEIVSLIRPTDSVTIFTTELVFGRLAEFGDSPSFVQRSTRLSRRRPPCHFLDTGGKLVRLSA